jgi:hypothetical protein
MSLIPQTDAVSLDVDNTLLDGDRIEQDCERTPEAFGAGRQKRY